MAPRWRLRDEPRHDAVRPGDPAVDRKRDRPRLGKRQPGGGPVRRAGHSRGRSTPRRVWVRADISDRLDDRPGGERPSSPTARQAPAPQLRLSRPTPYRGPDVKSDRRRRCGRRVHTSRPHPDHSNGTVVRRGCVHHAGNELAVGADSDGVPAAVDLGAWVALDQGGRGIYQVPGRDREDDGGAPGEHRRDTVG